MPENIIIKSDEIKLLARGQAVVEARQPINGDAKVLSVSATATATPSEVFAGEARYVGKVTFNCLVFADNEVKCVSSVAEFSDKITSPDIAAGTAVTLMPEVVNAEASIEGGTLKAVAVVDTSAVAPVGNEYSGMTAPDDGIYSETRTVNYSTANVTESETIYVTDSVGAGKTVDILYSESRAVITGAEAADNEIKVSGTVYTNAVVRLEDGMLSSIRIVTPFVRSVAAMGVKDGDTAFATAAVTESSVTLMDGNRVELAATVRLNVNAMTANTAEVVTDVFSADNEIQTTEQTMKCITVEPLCTVIDTVDGQVPIEADRLAADNVLCVTGTYCTLTTAKIENQRVNVEGLVGGDIVYYNAEKNAVDTLAFRLPFSMPLNIHTEATEVNAICTVTDVNVKIRRESVFDIKAEIAFTLMLSAETECGYIETVTKGEELARPDASVIIHIAKEGETLWQAAKALCCSPERVQQQNSAKAPYAGGERLVNFCNK